MLRPAPQDNSEIKYSQNDIHISDCDDKLLLELTGNMFRFTGNSARTFTIGLIVLPNQVAIRPDKEVLKHHSRVELLRNAILSQSGKEVIIDTQGLHVPNDIRELCNELNVPLNPKTKMCMEVAADKVKFNIHKSWIHHPRRIELLESMFLKFPSQHQILKTNGIEVPEDILELCSKYNVRIDYSSNSHANSMRR